MSHQTTILATKQIGYSVVPEPILEHYDRLNSTVRGGSDWSKMSEERIWKEVCFCILSANVSYDLVKSCIKILNSYGYLDPKWILSNKNSSRILYHLFNSSIFEPKKKDGSLRKYRYPKKRSKQIVQAARFIYSKNKTLKKILKEFDSDINARNYLAQHIPGLGIKEASHFLRNVRYSDSLAILDVHMLEFLRQRALIQLKKGYALTKNTYLRIETVLRNFVKFHKLNLAVFDLAVWYYMRNLR